MKYIRTKDGIYDYDEIYENKHNHTLRSQGTKEECFDFVYMMKSGIAKADTIEELCDEFVVVYKDSEPYLTQHLSYAEMEEYNLQVNGNNGIIYGAIWTDKGLIYVAKINEDGILCLI